MTETTNEFREWMDRLGLTAEGVAPRFNISPQTVAHWRSQGVPARRIEYVRYIMSNWAESTPANLPTGEVVQPFLIHPTHEQFRRWNQAALNAGQLIEEWAIEGLQTLAEEELADQSKPSSYLKVADESPDYKATRKTSGE